MNKSIEKASAFEFYIIRPFRAIFLAVGDTAVKLHRKINHSWYCEGCDKYHSGRVYEYSECPDIDSVCVKHIELKRLSQYTVYLAGKRCTGAVLPRIRKKYGIQPDERLCILCGQPSRDMGYCAGLENSGFVCAACCDDCHEAEPFPCPYREEREDGEK